MPSEPASNQNNDIFSQLQECQFRGLSFPIFLVNEDGGQRIIIHNRMDQDGALVESTGRKPYIFTVKGIFQAALVAGQYESWTSTPLFPDKWIAVKAALDTKDTGIFQHPLYGQLNVKPDTYTTEFSADNRSGCVCTMKFIETIDNPQQQQAAIQIPPLAAAATAAATLDSANLYNPDDDFSGDVSDLSTNSVPLSQWLGIATTTISSVSNFKTAILVNPALVSPSVSLSSTLSAADALTVSISQAANNTNTTGQATKTFNVTQKMTLADIANAVQNTTTQLLQLNPGLARTPIIYAPSSVTYYA
jgi:prophage DNA circulation protein